MKNYPFILLLMMFSNQIFSQNLEGSWLLVEESGKKVTDKEVYKIIQDGYFAVGAKNAANNEFLYAYGGEINLGDYSFTNHYDFHTSKSRMIGKKSKHRYILNGINLNVFSPNGKKEVWRKISSEENDLTGNWVITGRERNGEMSTMVPGDRRTIKILGGGRFQWVAFNSATGEFSGTGGGTYTAENGIYTENIDFFSRDSSRVGAELQFQYELKDGKWHHQGKSSKGDPIYEIWSPYNEAYSK